jgi:hypothetical protein
MLILFFRQKLSCVAVKQDKAAMAITLVVFVLLLGIIAIHDGVAGTTSIESVNNGDFASISISVRGRVTSSQYSSFTLRDSTGVVLVEWTGVRPEVDSIVVVRGTVEGSMWGYHYISASSVDVVWIFK